MKVELSKPFVDQECLDAMVRAASSGKHILQDECKSFEAEFAAYVGTKHAVLTNSGTSAIFLVLKALGVNQGDEVLVPSFTAFPTIEPIFHVGAIPVFCEVGDDYTVDVFDLEKRVTEKTKAILPVHLYGYPANIGRILEVGSRYGIPVVEDACQAHGSEFDGRKVGSFGIAGCFSFYPSKNMTVFGDGGILTTNDDQLAERIKMLRNHGRKARYDHEMVGYNLRFNEAQAAVGRVQLRHLYDFNAARRQHAETYQMLLSDSPLVLPGEDSTQRRHVYHLFVVRLENPEDKPTETRDRLKEFLKEKGIGTEIHYPIPGHLQSGTKAEFERLGLPVQSLPKTERYCNGILSLPMHPQLKPDEIRYVADNVRLFFDKL